MFLLEGDAAFFVWGLTHYARRDVLVGAPGVPVSGLALSVEGVGLLHDVVDEGRGRQAGPARVGQGAGVAGHVPRARGTAPFLLAGQGAVDGEVRVAAGGQRGRGRAGA